GQALINLDRLAEAGRHYRLLLETQPRNALYLTGLARCLFNQGRHNEGIDTNRRAIAADPKYVLAHRQLKDGYLILRRWEEGQSAWRQLLELNPPEHQAWDGYAELCLYLGNEAEYRRARTELLKRFGKATDPQVADRTGRACLFLPATDDELKQATALIDRAFAVEKPNLNWMKPYLRFAKALAEYRAGRMKNALELLRGDTLRTLPPAPSLLLAMVQHRLGPTAAA